MCPLICIDAFLSPKASVKLHTDAAIKVITFKIRVRVQRTEEGGHSYTNRLNMVIYHLHLLIELKLIISQHIPGISVNTFHMLRHSVFRAALEDHYDRYFYLV